MAEPENLPSICEGPGFNPQYRREEEWEKEKEKISNYVFYTKSDSLLTYFIFPVHLYFACIMFV